MGDIFLITLIYFMMILTMVTANCQVNCSFGCSCVEIESNKCSVVCTDRNLAEIPDYFPENTTSLDLSRNQITTIPSGKLNYLKSLEVLTIDDNLLKQLLPNTFSGLWSLREVSLENNELSINYVSLPINLFQNLTKVKILKLRGNIVNNYTSYIDKTISHLNSLEYLYIPGCFRCVFGKGYRNLSKLRNITFASKKKEEFMFYLGPRTFQNTPGIIYLNFNYCNLLKFNRFVFKHLPNLKILIISHNNQLPLKGIEYALKYLKSKFEIFVFSFMKLHDRTGIIINKAFTQKFQKTSLKRLILNSDHIEQFSWNSLKLFPKTLKYISLKNNYLEYGEYLFQIKTLSNIKVIDISMTSSQNNLLLPKTFFRKNFTHIFTFPKSLKTLLLQGCHYEFAIPPFYFRDASSIRLINATNNLLCPWIGPIRGLENLQILDLSNNQCDNVSNKFFTYFSGLRILKIENNVFGISDQVKQEGFSKTFLNLTNIEQLYLSNNLIEYLSNNSLLSLKKLKILSLRNNKLKTFDVKISHMFNLSYIDLSENFLTDIPEKTCQVIERLSEHHIVTVNVVKNTLKCSCDQIKFLIWLNKVKRSSQLKIMYHKCSHPNGTVWTLTDKQLQAIVNYLNHNCSPLIGIIIAISFAVVILILFLVASLIYHFRWKLRYLYYIIKGKYSYKRLAPDKYTYDAFIIYADKNRDFVLNYMIPELEEKENLCLNIHHRDFPAGKLITENILSAIQSSRKCVLLLSSYFIESKWCMFEYNLTKMEYIHTEINMIVVVVLEHVPHSKLPLPILQLIKNQSYIEFPYENEIAEEMFWRKLKHSIMLQT